MKIGFCKQQAKDFLGSLGNPGKGDVLCLQAVGSDSSVQLCHITKTMANARRYDPIYHIAFVSGLLEDVTECRYLFDLKEFSEAIAQCDSEDFVFIEEQEENLVLAWGRTPRNHWPLGRKKTTDTPIPMEQLPYENKKHGIWYDLEGGVDIFYGEDASRKLHFTVHIPGNMLEVEAVVRQYVSGKRYEFQMKDSYIPVELLPESPKLEKIAAAVDESKIADPVAEAESLEPEEAPEVISKSVRRRVMKRIETKKEEIVEMPKKEAPKVEVLEEKIEETQQELPFTPPVPEAAAEETAEQKAARIVRRSAEVVLKEKIEKAKELLDQNGYLVTERPAPEECVPPKPLTLADVTQNLVMLTESYQAHAQELMKEIKKMSGNLISKEELMEKLSRM